MNRFPEKQNEINAIRCYLASKNVKPFAINHMHTCTTECKYYTHTPSRTAVCKTSLQTHTCGKGICKHASHYTQEGRTCPITGFVVGPPKEIQAPKITQANTFERHWEIQGTKKKSTAKKVKEATEKTLKDTKETIRRIFNSKERQTMAETAKKKIIAATKKKFKEKKEKSLATVMNIINTELIHAATAVIGQTNINTQQITKIIQRELIALKRKGLQSKNTAITTAAILSQMQTGFKVKSCTLTPQLHIPKHYLPTQQQLGTMKGLHARAITLAIRKLKKFMVTPQGIPKPQNAIKI